jgi:hypothetical protein
MALDLWESVLPRVVLKLAILNVRTAAGGLIRTALETMFL